MRIMQDPIRIIDGKVCRLKSYLFTCALLVDVQGESHGRRYCYEKVVDAEQALAVWDGSGHSPGLWIKCKSATQEILNPEWAVS